MKKDGDLRSLFRRNLPLFDWVTIETGLTTPGVPDSNFCYKGQEGWVEFKRTSHWIVSSLDPLQVAWINRRTRNGGCVWVAVRKHHEGGPRLGPPVDELHLIHGSNILMLAVNGLRSLGTGIWTGGQRGWDWDAVGKTLLMGAGATVSVPSGTRSIP